MKLLMLTLFSLTFLSSCSAQNFVATSKKVEKTCANKSVWKGKTFHNLRTELYNDGRIAFVESMLDTLYILESYAIEAGDYTGKIWNSKGSLSYNYLKGRFNYPDKVFTDYTVRLVETWDTASIRKEEIENATSLPEKWIKATRIINQSGKVKIDCINFREFFKLERDR